MGIGHGDVTETTRLLEDEAGETGDAGEDPVGVRDRLAVWERLEKGKALVGEQIVPLTAGLTCPIDGVSNAVGDHNDGRTHRPDLEAVTRSVITIEAGGVSCPAVVLALGDIRLDITGPTESEGLCLT
jgi:hypothetical protein